jgi:hypothetical protein
MTTLNWTNEYDPAAPAYERPSLVSQFYDNNSGYPIEWGDPELQSIFTTPNRAANVTGGGNTSTSTNTGTSTGTSTSTSTGTSATSTSTCSTTGNGNYNSYYDTSSISSVVGSIVGGVLGGMAVLAIIRSLIQYKRKEGASIHELPVHSGTEAFFHSR